MQPIYDYLSSMGAWNWIFLGIILFVLETVMPGVYLLWFGVAAVIVGVLTFMFDVTLQWELILFGVVSMLTVLAVRRFAKTDVVASDEPDLNVRGQQYVGRIVTVETAISGGRGRVRVGDSMWSAEGPDMPIGAQARVTAVHGTVLRIEPFAH